MPDLLDSFDFLKPHLFEPRGVEGKDAKEQWRKDNMAVTGPSALIYLCPIVWMALLGKYWIVGNVVTSAIGIWRSPGISRKICGAAVFVLLALGHLSRRPPGDSASVIVVFGIWYLLYGCRCLADGRDRNRRQRGEEW